MKFYHRQTHAILPASSSEKARRPALPAGKQMLRVLEVPAKNDPRWIFAGLLTLYAAVGFTVLGFNRDPMQVLLTVLACVGLDFFLARILRRE